ncbi:MAG TPA: hypothetical protein VMU59_04225 [Caulobacteraceae bacterium]|nr:hypothetical protein [Caulobacteraceae bacterium]
MALVLTVGACAPDTVPDSVPNAALLRWCNSTGAIYQTPDGALYYGVQGIGMQRVAPGANLALVCDPR